MSAPYSADNIRLSQDSSSLSQSYLFRDTDDQLSFRTAADGTKLVSMKPEVAVIVDEKSNNTAGGTYTTPNVIIRDLNTIRYSQSWVSLPGSNVIRIDGATYPGVYFFKWISPGHHIDEFYTTLHNITTDEEYPSLTCGAHELDIQVNAVGTHVETLTASTDTKSVLLVKQVEQRMV